MRKLFKITLLLAMLAGMSACAGKGASSADAASSAESASDASKAMVPASSAPAAAEQPEEETYRVLDTACGSIKGVQKDGYAVYKGLRYATAERWEHAVPVTGWEGEYDATKFGDWACQFEGFFHTVDSSVNRFYYDEATVHFPVGFSEDCLNLNIWTPDDAANCPVLFFIHGGAFVTGGNSDAFIDGEAYAKRGVIVVSINYRLGPFAAVYGDGYTGDYQMTDQITALQWVRDNIADYGGDPTKITIMGESAGALSVQNLLVSPLAEGLMQGAVMMSGGGDLSSLGTPTAPANVEAVWDAVKKKMAVSTLDELKDVPAASLYSNWLQCYASMPQYAISATAPIINGTVLPSNVKDALANGTTADVPCIFGVLSEDMYPHTLYTSALSYAVSQDAAGKAPVYLYYFDRQLPGENDFGAFHAADLWYMFGTLHRNWRPFDEIDLRISENMMDYITNFVKTGDPNGGELFHWEPVTADRKQSLNFGDKAPTMCTPSLDALQTTQNTRPAFPYK